MWSLIQLPSARESLLKERPAEKITKFVTGLNIVIRMFRLKCVNINVHCWVNIVRCGKPKIVRWKK